VASIYETIIGASYATAAGIDPAKAIADIVSAPGRDPGHGPERRHDQSQHDAAQIDIAVKAATAGYLLGEAIKADVGVYAGAANNFLLGLVTGNAVYNTDITETYKPSESTGSHGTGHAVDTAPTTLPGAEPPPPPEPAATPLHFTLTTGVDNFTGGELGDDFTGSDTTFNGADVLNGGGGADSLNVTAATGASYILPGATISGIETATLSNNNDLSANTTTWTGLTTLTTTAVGATTLTAAATTDIGATTTAQGAGMVIVNGGHDVTITATGATTGLIDIGSVTSPTGAIVISRATTGAVAAGSIGVEGGTSVNITQTASNAVNTTQTNGAVNIIGSSATTSVTVKATKAATADGATAGVIANTVTITDTHAGSATSGAITSIDVDGYSTVTIADSALATLKLAHGGGNISIDNSAATSPATTLNLTLNGVTGGVLDDANRYTTINVTTGAEASTLDNIIDTALTTLNVGGASRLTLDAISGMTSLTSMTISGAGGLTSNLVAGTLTSVDASASTGNNILTIRPAGTTYTGGSGVDAITLSTFLLNKAISLGGGDDILTLVFATPTAAATIDGGTGVDTVVMELNTAAAVSTSGGIDGKFIGFEVLETTGNNSFNSSATVDMAKIGGMSTVVLTTAVNVGGGGTLQFDNFAAGGTLKLTASTLSGAIVLANSAFTGGANDTVNLVLSKSAALDAGGLTVADVEHINVTTVDTSGAPTGAFFDTLPITDAALKTLTISGNAGVDLSTLTSTALTSLDASGLTLGGLKVTLGGSAGSVTIKGGVTGANTIDTSGTSNDVTYVGGSGVDTVTLAGGKNTVTLGTGADRVNVAFAALDPEHATTITDFASGDSLSFAGVTSGVGSLGAATSVIAAPSLLAALDSVAVGDGSGTPLLKWFVYGGDTYVVADISASASFQAGADFVVKLTGVLDLSTTSVAGTVITL
jgi:S-layer protein